MYQRQRELKTLIDQTTSDSNEEKAEYSLLEARVNGTLATLWALGMTVINGEAKK